MKIAKKSAATPSTGNKEKYYREIAELYNTVATKFDECEESIFAAQDAVGYSNLARATKTKLVKKFQAVWADMQEIVDTLGRCGKVK